MADIQITQDEMDLVVDLYNVISELEDANSVLYKFYEIINEAYAGESTSQIMEYVSYMQKHIGQLTKFYGIGANYILSTWEKFSEADRNTAMNYILYKIMPTETPEGG